MDLDQAAGAPAEKGDAPAFIENSRLMVGALAITGKAAGPLVTRAQAKPAGAWEDNWNKVPDSRDYGLIGGGRTSDGRVAFACVGRGVCDYFEEKFGPDTGEWEPRQELGIPDGTYGLLGARIGIGFYGVQSIVAIDSLTNAIFMRSRQKPAALTAGETVAPDAPFGPWHRLEGESGFTTFTTAQLGTRGLAVIAGFGGGPSTDNTHMKYYWNREVLDERSGGVSWSGWEPVAEDIPGSGGGEVVAQIDDGQRLNLFCVGENQVFHTRLETPSSGKWLPWRVLAQAPVKLADVTAAQDADRRIVLMSRGEGKLLTNVLRDSQTENWSGWSIVHDEIAQGRRRVMLDWEADGRLVYFQLDGAMPAVLASLRQAAPNSTSWEATPFHLGNGFYDFAVVRDLAPPA